MKTSTNLLALAAPALLALAACVAPVNAVESPRGVPVRTVVVERRDLDDNLLLTGTLKPRAQVQVVSEVSARLLSVGRDVGARAAKGDALALLDDTDYRLAAERAKAALEAAEANGAHALVEKERADNLLKTGGITDKDRLSAEVNLRLAEASRAQAKAEAAVAGVQLGRCTVRAPFSGRVAKRMVDAGSMLAVGTPLFTFVDDSVIEVRASVPSADYARVVPGAPVDVTVDAMPGYTAKGKVARVTPLVEERTRSFEVVVEVPGEKNLGGGLFARAAVRVGRVPGALVVPPAAVVRDGSRPDEAHVFVVAAGKAERRAVSLGVESSDAIQVKQGLTAGDVVVLDPPVALGSGAPVEIQNRTK